MSAPIDISKIAPNKKYLVPGRILIYILQRLDSLWSGENVERGPGIFIRRAGSAGYNLATRKNGNGRVSTETDGALQPGADVSFGTTYRITITYGTYAGAPLTIDDIALVPDASANIITLAEGDKHVYAQVDFTYDTGTGMMTVTDRIISSTPDAVPDSTISGGSGTLYQELFGVTTSVDGAGKAHVLAAPAVSSSQNFSVCLAGPSISGPWRV